MNLIISDIDGVIADCSHRMHWQKAKCYDEFYSDANIERDEPIEDGITLLNMLENSGDDVRIALCSGRNEMCKDATRRWLCQRAFDSYDALYMRKNKDYRSSDIVKPEMVEEIIRSYIARDVDLHHIYFIDDDPKNVKAVCERFGDITGIIYGKERLDNEDNA